MADDKRRPDDVPDQQSAQRNKPGSLDGNGAALRDLNKDQDERATDNPDRAEEDSRTDDGSGAELKDLNGPRD